MPPKTASVKRKEKEQKDREQRARDRAGQSGPSADNEDSGEAIDRPSAEEQSASPVVVVLPSNTPKTKTKSSKKKKDKQEKELERQIEEVQREVRILERQAELSALTQRRAALLQARVPSAPTPVPAALPSAPSPENLTARLDAAAEPDTDQEDEEHQDDVVTLHTVKKAGGISRQVDARWAELGLDVVPEVDGEPGSRGKKPVSGRVAKVESNVDKTLIWPHSMIDPRFVPQLPSYDELDFALLVAGEIGIAISPKTPKAESKNRLHLLRLLAYCYKLCNWPMTKQFHSSAISELEKGRKSWAQFHYSDISTALVLVAAQGGADQAAAAAVPANQPILPAPAAGAAVQPQLGGARPRRRFRNINSRRPASQQRTPSRFFCSAFNRNSCHHAGAHRGEVGGREVLVEHICATCLREFGEIASHAETINCPRYQPRS
jgi:hypothetical protein